MEATQFLGESLFHEAIEDLLTDREVFRTVTVMYMLQAFYAEGLLRSTGILDGKSHEWVRDPATREHYFLNLEVFHNYLRDKLVFKLNSERSLPGFHGLDLMCGMAGRPGKVAGCPVEYKKLLKAFNSAQDGFVQNYIHGRRRRDASLRGSEVRSPEVKSP